MSLSKSTKLRLQTTIKLQIKKKRQENFKKKIK